MLNALRMRAARLGQRSLSTNNLNCNAGHASHTGLRRAADERDDCAIKPGWYKLQNTARPSGPVSAEEKHDEYGVVQSFFKGRRSIHVGAMRMILARLSNEMV
jgi:hypothetical protein